MMVFKPDLIKLAEISQAVGFVPGMAAAHACASAELRKAEAAFEAFAFARDEAVVGIHAVRGEDAIVEAAAITMAVVS